MLHSKCQAFVSNLQMGQDDANNRSSENLDHFIHEDESDGTSYVKRKKKKYKNSMKSFKGIGFVLSLIMISLLVYYLLIYFLTSQTIANAKQLLKEFNYTNLAEVSFIITSNIQRQLLIDSKSKIFSQNIKSVFQTQLDEVIYINHQLSYYFTENQALHTQSYTDLYNSLMNSDGFCDSVFSSSKINSC